MSFACFYAGFSLSSLRRYKPTQAATGHKIGHSHETSSFPKSGTECTPHGYRSHQVLLLAHHRPLSRRSDYDNAGWSSVLRTRNDGFTSSVAARSKTVLSEGLFSPRSSWPI